MKTPAKTNITLHPIAGEGGFALVGEDIRANAFQSMRFEPEELSALAAVVERYAKLGQHDGEIFPDDERLGWEHISVAEAVALSAESGTPVAAISIKKACQQAKISASKPGRDWRIAKTSFFAWLHNAAAHKRGPKRKPMP